MMIRLLNLLAFGFLLSIILSCQNSDRQKLFTKIPANETGVNFSNDLQFEQDFNIYRYRNFYNGGGVAIGDVNNDGLVDLFFTANMKKNRLYLNRGNFKFVDVTEKAQVGGKHAWTTGVSMVDVNGDGLLDIYVCNSGIVNGDDRRNELFINNGDTTFTEEAATYGIDDGALSIQGNFFDYDHDGDLDLYLVNNSYRAIGSFDQKKNTRLIRDDLGGDKLYRNDGNHFTDVSKEAGIYSSEIGFGLGASVSDVNRDGWPDLYVSNDFFERDYLYLNNRDGTFREVLEQQMKSISAAAMGGDAADMNGDGYPEIFVTDMLPRDEKRLKRVTTFDSWERYKEYVKDGYFHQFTRNTLQLNNGNGSFSEVSRYAGVDATDWSWGANLVDLNLDGRRDIFVANGMYQDITDLDYLQEVSQQDMVKRIVRDSTINFKKLIDIIPSNPISDYAFYNSGEMRFADSTASWGLDYPGFSNGSAYGDLDNDGDPDLVINNLNEKASIYKNNATTLHPDRHWLRIDLEGKEVNTDAIGTEVTAWAEGRQWYAEQFPIRGFQSAVDHRLLFGFGDVETIDSLIVNWNNGGVTKKRDVKTNQELILDEGQAQSEGIPKAPDLKKLSYKFRDITSQLGVRWSHKEDSFNDFKRDHLLYQMRSTEGPPVCTSDINNDNLEDFYVGGAKGQPGVLFVQQPGGIFSRQEVAAFQKDASSEDIDCTWFDANGDGNQDLYVASGGNEFPSSSSALADRLYFQKSGGGFQSSELGFSNWKYKTAGSVSAADFDGDGDIDLFLGIRLQPFAVGMPVDSYILQNDGDGHFTDVTEDVAPELKEIGMVTDSRWGDIDEDGDMDLLVSGEWMPLTIFENDGGKFTRKTLENTAGWWHSLLLEDLDGDGDLDILAGNHGLNSRFKASHEYPIELWVNDFDNNGTIDPIITNYKDGSSYPVALRHDLIEQLPYLENKYPTYKSYAGKTIRDIFPPQKLDQSYHNSVTQLASVVGWNDGTGTFRIQELPMKAQLTTIYGLCSTDLNGDGRKELLMGGNLYNTDPEVGRYDAGYGTVLGIKDDSLITLPAQRHGLRVDGQIRAIKSINIDGIGKVILVARNNDSIRLF
ncbi:MAG: VCBS repeat-containing protein, partial [Balneolaceae bacterium]